MLSQPWKHRLYACPADGGAIVLDLTSEKYYVADSTVLSSDTGISQTSCIDATHFNRVDMDKLVALPPAATSASATPRYVSALTRSVLRVTATRTLLRTPGVIRGLATLKQGCSGSLEPAPNPRLSSAVYVFRHLRPLFYTARAHCLFDALIFTDYLLRLGQDAQFVIGIRTRPFEAHAWTQSGSYVLEDRVEKVQLFTPILVV